MYKQKENFALYVTVAVAAVFTIIFCIAYSGASKLQTDLNYYFVYRYVADNAVSASSLSYAAESYGGAGYILSYDSEFYIIIACYYDQTSADSVSFTLKSRGTECGVLAVSVSEKTLSRANAPNAELFSGNINTLEQLGKILYNSANGIDAGGITQSGARGVLQSARSTLEGLFSANSENCFSDGLSDLLTICEDILNDDFIYSKNVRKLQIAVIDCIIKVDLS